MTRQTSQDAPVPRLTVILDSTSASLAEGLTHRQVAKGDRVLTFHISSTRPGLISLLSAHRTFEHTGWGIHVVRPDNTDYAFSLATRLKPSVLMFVIRPGEPSSFPGKGAVRVQLNDEDRVEADLVQELARVVRWVRKHRRTLIWAEVMHEGGAELPGLAPASSI